MKAVWHIIATIVEYTDVKHPEKGYVVRQVPSFSLDEDLLGIVDENHARKLACDVVNITRNKNITVNAAVMRFEL